MAGRPETRRGWVRRPGGRKPGRAETEEGVCQPLPQLPPPRPGSRAPPSPHSREGDGQLGHAARGGKEPEWPAAQGSAQEAPLQRLQPPLRGLQPLERPGCVCLPGRAPVKENRKEGARCLPEPVPRVRWALPPVCSLWPCQGGQQPEFMEENGAARKRCSCMRLTPNTCLTPFRPLLPHCVPRALAACSGL